MISSTANCGGGAGPWCARGCWVTATIGAGRQPAGLKALSGTEQIHCWLADRDITPELPHALLGAPAARVPDQIAGDLDSLFSRIGGTRIESDVLTVTSE